MQTKYLNYILNIVSLNYSKITLSFPLQQNTGYKLVCAFFCFCCYLLSIKFTTYFIRISPEQNFSHNNVPNIYESIFMIPFIQNSKSNNGFRM